jgi:hypothetical protein
MPDEVKTWLETTRYYAALARRHRFMTKDREQEMRYFIKAQASLLMLQACRDVDAKTLALRR